MSLLAPGTRCSSCTLIDFLPLLCPSCDLPFCSDHIHTHQPCSSFISTSSHGVAVGKLDRGKKSCEKEGCERETIESVAGVSGRDEEERIAREVRCEGCGGSFCTSHRAQTSHSCPAPLIHNVRHDDFLVRRSRAEDLIAKNFAGHKDRVERKMPIQKDVVKRPRTEEDKLPPSVQPAQSTSTATPETTQEEREVEKKVKSKAEKLWDIHLRKIRSTATHLGGGANIPDMDKIFFEWGIDLTGTKVKTWKGKWDTKLERAWVREDIPIGKVMDLIIAQSKTSRMADAKFSLVQLYPAPDGLPSSTSLSSHQPAKVITQGAALILVRGEMV
ncbi:hypothetical protein I309_04845 [Cryptococcus deuterogattii LA55]|nr:hypothetical protein I309_04845 [Cryptococcus deuterogattii LA55]KIR92070.1 hypothetical protein I304_04237 [Cryptococcus deuterogattii CBS 10090]